MPAVAEGIRVEELSGDDPEVAAMLVDLTLDEQEHYDHPPETRDQVESRLQVAPRFSGENHLFVARDVGGAVLGVCWVVLFDPGTGLEAELAELYVRPQSRGGGVAGALVAESMALIRDRHVSFASVWTRDDNPAAVAAYRAAGFAPTEQAVLTWLPIHDQGGAGVDLGRE
jgi:ribosomal protein S18 acetylase RimI-like enzyme